MKHVKNLMDRIDEVRVNSVTEDEYERVWNRSLDEQVSRMMVRWDELMARAKEAVDAQEKA
ncbi:hypothetical protein SAMN05216518_10883 [Bacteroidales bacterium KHT7]|jgi:hypothetical protein|uniref:hypothetical protein n=1 Tax=unclassified Bacteroides TaxID=2646097 RepID=UPI0004E22896|nr:MULTISPECIES: hypothetical protein [unclassified Bacteroides]MBQ3772605.1 hypothetical protein [Bacteroidaceae bacterium]SDF52668.1 hypothetical protein SAMN05216518_10883 [Bacteroidales bacterium KHT7]